MMQQTTYRFKIISLLLMGIFFFVPHQALGQEDELERADLALVNRFYEFEPTGKHVDSDTALFGSLAFYYDDGKALAALGKWPKRELKALYLLINEFDRDSFSFSEEKSLALRPMTYWRSLRRFLSEIQQLAGAPEQRSLAGMTLTGRLGASTPTYYGNDGSADYILYPENFEDPVIIFFTVETLGYSEDEVYDCINRKVRITFKGERTASKIEYLDSCVKSDL